MLSEEETGGGEATSELNFDLPEELLQLLPQDPFEQLDVARRITSIALSTRVSSLESELSALQHSVDERDSIISNLQSQIESLDSSLSHATDKLSQAELEKERLLKENATLTSSVRKLNRDVVKVMEVYLDSQRLLESFRKTLMRSLQDEDENPANKPAAFVPHAQNSEDDSPLRSQLSETGHSQTEDNEAEESRPRISKSMFLASQTSTPKLTPPVSPPSVSASVSPSRSPKPLSPRRHSMSFSTTRGMFDDRSSGFSVPPSQYSSMPGYESQSGRTRMDGKEFFRQVRSRLSYEQFGAFLANVKDLNSHKQTKEETLRKAEEMFGSDNKDLYDIFVGLITRNVQT